ncbi:MAG: response regulator [Desulforhopalus sp.]
MFSLYNKSSHYLYIPFVFLLVFSFIAYIYVVRAADRDQKIFKTHAVILADDIWALNQSGADGYLQLAVKANHYKSLSVSIPGNDPFISVTSSPLTGLPFYLYKMNLIGLKQLSQDIMHEDRTIGTLRGEKYVRVIFPVVNILIFFLLLSLTAIFIIHLYINRNLLEQQVQERTRNLLESERRFHDLVNLLPEMVLETDPTGNITYANKAAKNHLQLTVPQPAAVDFFHFIEDSERAEAKQNFQKCLKGEWSGLVEYNALSPDNKIFPILIRSAPITQGAVVSGTRMIVIDITERRLLEQQLHRDQKMKAIGLMAGGVAHDLNNILSGVISYPELLLLDLDEKSKLRPSLEAIRRSGLDASEVVSDLLTVARGIAANKEIVAPNKLIHSYLNSTDYKELQTRYPLVTFRNSLDPELYNISGSPVHVRKCLMNLIINGVEAIQGKGVLTISTSNHEQVPPYSKQIESGPQSLPQPGIYSKIIIRDSGSGIATHDMDRIFEPFYTKKVLGRSGTGLGLTVVWNTMRDHGGTVNIISGTQGTTFELYFPSVKEKIAPKTEQKDWKTYRGKGEKILVIDDEKRQRQIAGQLLKSLHYRVHTVSSGEEAVEYLKENSADLLVLDMIMAPGMNGRKTFEQILKDHPHQNAIIASGYAADEDVLATLAMGAKAFLPKPYTLGQIGLAMYKIFHP